MSAGPPAAAGQGLSEKPWLVSLGLLWMLLAETGLWMLLAETGLRLGEALGLQHRDWHTGRGDTPFIEVVDREHPHGVRAKSEPPRVRCTLRYV